MFRSTEDVTIALEDGKVVVKPVNDGKQARAMWGTARARIQGIVTGVSEGFTRELEINGVGYRAARLVRGSRRVRGYVHWLGGAWRFTATPRSNNAHGAGLH